MLLLLLLLLPSPLSASLNTLSLSRSLMTLEPRSVVLRFVEDEQDRLPAACRGFISFLEQHDAVDAPLREAIIERALALPDAEVSLDRLKVIVLAVIWRYRHEVDALILEELLAEDSEDEDFGVGEDVTRILLH